MNNKITDILLTVDDLSVYLNNKPLFEDFTLSLKKDEKCVIYGKSGCGKSTFLSTLLGFTPNFSGQIIFNNSIRLLPENVHLIRQLTAWVPQETAQQFTFGKEVFDTLFSFKNNRNIRPKKEEIIAVLADLNLDESILEKPFSVLSGGEKQRLLIAAGLLQKKPLLLLDEPTAALDKSNRKAVINAIHNYPYACIIVSHDNELIAAFDKKINFESFAV
mgnify:FL=1